MPALRRVHLTTFSSVRGNAMAVPWAAASLECGNGRRFRSRAANRGIAAGLGHTMLMAILIVAGSMLAGASRAIFLKDDAIGNGGGSLASAARPHLAAPPAHVAYSPFAAPLWELLDRRSHVQVAWRHVDLTGGAPDMGACCTGCQSIYARFRLHEPGRLRISTSGCGTTADGPGEHWLGMYASPYPFSEEAFLEPAPCLAYAISGVGAVGAGADAGPWDDDLIAAPHDCATLELDAAAGVTYWVVITSDNPHSRLPLVPLRISYVAV